MALFVSVSADNERTSELMDSLHESFLQEFARRLEEHPWNEEEEPVIGILRACLDPEQYDIEATAKNAWRRIVEEGEHDLDAFTEGIANTTVKDFVLVELSDCGLKPESFDGGENHIVSQASFEIAKRFASSIPNTSAYAMSRCDFKDERIDPVLSIAYQILTEQVQDDLQASVTLPL